MQAVKRRRKLGTGGKYIMICQDRYSGESQALEWYGVMCRSPRTLLAELKCGTRAYSCRSWLHRYTKVGTPLRMTWTEFQRFRTSFTELWYMSVLERQHERADQSF